MKRVVWLAGLVFLWLIPLSGWAQGDYEYLLDGHSYAQIVRYQGPGGQVDVPEQLDGHQVVEIQASAFEGREDITGVSLPDTVRSVGARGFYGCTALTQIELPDSIEALGESCFQGCTSLEEFRVPARIKELESSIFEGCERLKQVEMQDSVHHLRSRVFYGCSSLSELRLPGHLRSVGADAMGGTPWLAAQTQDFVVVGQGVLIAYNGTEEQVELPDGVFYIGDAFEGNDTMVSIVIPRDIKEIQNRAFAGCTALTQVRFESGVGSVGYKSFENCTALRAVELPESVSSVGAYAFAGCTQLEQADFSRALHLTELNASIFQNCERLSAVRLPESVTEIGAYAFSGCKSLAQLEFGAGSQLAKVGGYAFEACTALAQLELPGSVTEIGHSAFKDSGLTQITLPEGVSSLPGQVFSGCSRLEWIQLPWRLHDIERDALDGCEAEIRVEYGSRAEQFVKRRGRNYRYAVKVNHGLEYVRDAEGVTVTRLVEPRAVADLPTKLDGSAVTRLGVAAFQNQTELTRVVLPDTLKVIGEWAFSYCTALSEVRLPDGLERIEADALQGCAALERLRVPPSVTFIGERAFKDCGQLTLVVTAGSEAERYAQQQGLNYEVE